MATQQERRRYRGKGYLHVDPEIRVASLHQEHTKRGEQKDEDNETAVANHDL